MTVSAQRAGRLDLGPPFDWRRRGETLWIEALLPAGRAAFSTRVGGRSSGPYESLNLGILTDDEQELVALNRQILARAVERDPAAFAMGLQVHGADVQRHTARPEASSYLTRGLQMAKVDAHVTVVAEVTPLVLTADCIPLVLASPGAVGAVHCGWRGVAEGIVGNALEALCEVAASAKSAVTGVLGPGIAQCCYTVGPEVTTVFRARGHEDSIAGGNRLDLPKAVRAELERAGVSPERIHDVGMCTSCNPSHFFSHRRDHGVTGRQAGLAWLA